jgi:hypothetical protein
MSDICFSLMPYLCHKLLDLSHSCCEVIGAQLQILVVVNLLC